MDVKVTCTNHVLGGQHQPFKEVSAQMEHSIFCLVPPGDSPSVRRLSETFLAGVAQQRGCRRLLHVAAVPEFEYVVQVASLYSSGLHGVPCP